MWCPFRNSSATFFQTHHFLITQALKLYKRSVELGGDPHAYARVGSIYIDGVGTAVNEVDGVYYLEEAAVSVYSVGSRTYIVCSTDRKRLQVHTSAQPEANTPTYTIARSHMNALRTYKHHFSCKLTTRLAATSLPTAVWAATFFVVASWEAVCLPCGTFGLQR